MGCFKRPVFTCFCSFVCLFCVCILVTCTAYAGRLTPLFLAGMGKLFGEKWRALTPEQKKEYDELALKDQERYQKELAQVQRADA